MSRRPTSIFEGIGSLVDDWLRIPPKGKPPYFQHKSAALYLSDRRPKVDDPDGFLERCYAQIERNYQSAVSTGSTSRSSENWRWNPRLNISPENKQPEIVLERALVRTIPALSNQMPTASGLVKSRDSHANVDLVFRHDEVSFEFIELKVASNTPLSAAIQILQYGLLWFWSRAHAGDLGYSYDDQPVLRATQVDLRVTAPSPYYCDYNFGFLAQALNAGLKTVTQSHDVNLSFAFEAIPATSNATTGDLVEAFSRRAMIW